MTDSPSILIIEDEHALAGALAAVCRRLGRQATLCSSGQRGLEEAGRMECALAVLDIGLPDVSGLAVLEELRRRWPQLPVLIITAHGNLDNAVAAKKLGAAGYLVKPLDLTEVQETLRQLLSAAPATAAPPRNSLTLLVGAAPAMQRRFVEIAHACATEAPVLITGAYRHWQNAHGAGDSLEQRARNRSIHHPAMRLAAGTPARERVVRIRETRIHRPLARPGRGTSNAPRVERFFWMRSPIFRRPFRRSFCGLWKSAHSPGSGDAKICAWIFG